MKTYSPKAKDIRRNWYVVDARDAVLGRLAVQVATILRGKHKPGFAPHLDTGDHVIVVNADGVRLTGDKVAKKAYYRHSGYPGGLRSIPFARLASD
ncbi:MAG: 50S ribosomal protein L13, partial [Actinomycetota bacterium]|nr:50S ribosomal protein L13 [Actinomycetota bacterium]